MSAPDGPHDIEVVSAGVGPDHPRDACDGCGRPFVVTLTELRTKIREWEDDAFEKTPARYRGMVQARQRDVGAYVHSALLSWLSSAACGGRCPTLHITCGHVTLCPACCKFAGNDVR